MNFARRFTAWLHHLWLVRAQDDAGAAGLPAHGRRSRKSCGPSVAGSVTVLVTPSSATLLPLVAQAEEGAGDTPCSKMKPSVSAEGQETVIWPGVASEGFTVSAGSWFR